MEVCDITRAPTTVDWSNNHSLGCYCLNFRVLTCALSLCRYLWAIEHLSHALNTWRQHCGDEGCRRERCGSGGAIITLGENGFVWQEKMAERG